MSKKSEALGSVRLSLDISDQYGRDASAGIVTVPKATYQETTIEVIQKLVDMKKQNQIYKIQ